MRRTEIPDRLLAARKADIDRIPLATLAKLTRATLANRLVAAGEFRRRAQQRYQPPETARFYTDLAAEVLKTTDLKRAAELLKTAGVTSAYSPEQLQEMLRAGTAIKLRNGHIAAIGTVRDLRYWVTVAEGALGRGTPEDSAPLRTFLARRAAALGVPDQIPAGWGRPPAASSAKSAAPSRAITVARAEAAARQLAAAGAFGPVVKAQEYERQAAVLTDPGMQQGYLELARREREKAGAS